MQYPVTISGVKARLIGLGPWFQGAEAFPAPYAYGTAQIRRAIEAAVDEFQRMSLFQLIPVQCSTPKASLLDSMYPPSASFPLMAEDGYDLYTGETAYIRFRLRRKPVIQVQRMSLWVNDQPVINFPVGWLNLSKRSGEVYVLPTQGSALVSATLNATILLSQSKGSFLPKGVQVDYQAGMPRGFWADTYAMVGNSTGTITVFASDPLTIVGTGTNFTALAAGSHIYLSDGSYLGQVQCVNSATNLSLEWPVDATITGVTYTTKQPGVNTEWSGLIRALEEYAAWCVLNDIAHMADAGIDGVNLHGYTSGQTFNYTRFADRKQELIQSVQQYVGDLKDQETPILMGFV